MTNSDLLASDRLAPRVYQMLHFPLHGAGAGVYARTLCEHLTARGYGVRALRAAHTPADDPYPGETLLFRGATGRAYDLDFDFPVFISHPCSSGPTFGELSAAQRTRYEHVLRAAIERGLRDFAPEIVHVHHGWLIASLLAEFGISYVVTLHGSELHAFAAFPAYREAVCRGLADAAAVMAVSDPVAADAVVYGLDPAAIRVVPSGVDLARFCPLVIERRSLLAGLGVQQLELPVVLFSGRLIRIKGVDTLLRALDRCRRAGQQFTALIAGDGSEATWLHRLARELRLDSVYFLGQQSHAVLPALYNVADVVVVPSREDALPLAALEAQACGTPVIGSSVGALPRSIDAQSGLIVPPDDELALADALIALLRTRRKEMHGPAIAAHARAAFSFDRTTDAVTAVYREVLGGGAVEESSLPREAA